MQQLRAPLNFLAQTQVCIGRLNTGRTSLGSVAVISVTYFRLLGVLRVTSVGASTGTPNLFSPKFQGFSCLTFSGHKTMNECKNTCAWIILYLENAKEPKVHETSPAESFRTT